MKTFYRIESEVHNDPIAEFNVVLNETHPVFDVHFPGYPIVPGVMMFLMIRELTQKTSGVKLKLAEVQQAKFLRPILRTARMNLTVVLNKQADEPFSVRAEILCDGVPHFRGLFCWSKDQPQRVNPIQSAKMA